MSNKVTSSQLQEIMNIRKQKVQIFCTVVIKSHPLWVALYYNDLYCTLTFFRQGAKKELNVRLPNWRMMRKERFPIRSTSSSRTRSTGRIYSRSRLSTKQNLWTTRANLLVKITNLFTSLSNSLQKKCHQWFTELYFKFFKSISEKQKH